MSVKQKVVDTLLWIGGGVALLLLVAMCTATEYVEKSKKYKILAPGIEDMCSTVEDQACGLHIKDCLSQKEYRCVTNASVEEMR